MGEVKDLVFQSRNQGVAMRYGNVVGWQLMFRDEPILAPHFDKALADKGETIPTGKVQRATVIRLFLVGGNAMELTKEVSAEFRLFVTERIKPEIWQAENEVAPEIQEIDNPGPQKMDGPGEAEDGPDGR